MLVISVANGMPPDTPPSHIWTGSSQESQGKHKRGSLVNLAASPGVTSTLMSTIGDRTSTIVLTGDLLFKSHCRHSKACNAFESCIRISDVLS